MAENKKKEEEEVAPPEGKKSSSMMLVIIIVVLILVILIGVVVTILMMGGDSKSEEKASKDTEKTEKIVGEKKAVAGGAEESRTLDKIGILYPLDTFTVNLMSENGSRYLKAQISLELSGKELTEELDAKKAVLRDKILRLLSSKSVEEVSTLKGKDQLSEQILQQLNPMLKDGSINGVYFTDFVIQ
ncbi:MAG: flagellar basal body-associated protein FliL [Thiovulaceae bacterium]|nr:flagellar basal body-associated protein FliL [Sulfurimonadaceae bacterium]